MINSILTKMRTPKLWFDALRNQFSQTSEMDVGQTHPGQSYSLSYAEADAQVAAPKRDRRTRLLM